MEALPEWKPQIKPLAAEPGFEPESEDPKSPVLPLHHSASVTAACRPSGYARTYVKFLCAPFLLEQASASCSNASSETMRGGSYGRFLRGGSAYVSGRSFCSLMPAPLPLLPRIGAAHPPSKRQLCDIGPVPKVGVEPTRGHPHRFLRAARLPVPPLRQVPQARRAWCGREDSNLHEEWIPRQPLKLVRLPIPPHPRANDGSKYTGGSPRTASTPAARSCSAIAPRDPAAGFRGGSNSGTGPL